MPSSSNSPTYRKSFCEYPSITPSGLPSRKYPKNNLPAVFPPEAGKFDPPGNSLGWDVHQISCKPEKRRSRPIITSVNLGISPRNSIRKATPPFAKLSYFHFIECKRSCQLLGIPILAQKALNPLAPCSSKYQIALCQRPSVLRKTLSFVVSRFCGTFGGSSLRIFSSATNATVQRLVIFRPILGTGRRKTPRLLSGPSPGSG